MFFFIKLDFIIVCLIYLLICTCAVYFGTCICPITPVESIREASLTVLPQMSKTGFLAPITPQTNGPQDTPIRKPKLLKECVFTSSNRCFIDKAKSISAHKCSGLSVFTQSYKIQYFYYQYKTIIVITVYKQTLIKNFNIGFYTIHNVMYCIISTNFLPYV